MFAAPFFAAIGTGATAGVATGTAAVVAGVATTAIVAGGVVSAVGAIQQGKEARRQAEFQAKQAELESQEQKTAASVAATNAANAERDAEYSYDQIMRERARAQGANRVAVAKSGLTFSGSAVDVAGDTAAEFETEANRTYMNNLNVAGNYRGSSSALMRSSGNSLLTATEYRRAGRATQKSSYWSAGGSILSAVGTVGLGYAGWASRVPAAAGAGAAGAGAAGAGAARNVRIGPIE